MHLEFLADGSADCPLIRLYRFSSNEAAQLHAAMAELATGRADRVELHELPFVTPLGNCRLSLVCWPWNAAIVRTGPHSFDCRFAEDMWDDVAGLVQPFALTSTGFQWLAGAPGDASLLLSTSGRW